MRKNMYMDNYFNASFLSVKYFIQTLIKLFKTEKILQFKFFIYLCTLGSLK